MVFVHISIWTMPFVRPGHVVRIRVDLPDLVPRLHSVFHTKPVHYCVILILIHCDSSRHHTSSSPLKLVLCGFPQKTNRTFNARQFCDEHLFPLETRTQCT